MGKTGCWLYLNSYFLQFHFRPGISTCCEPYDFGSYCWVHSIRTQDSHMMTSGFLRPSLKKNVSIKVLLSRIGVYLIWPQYSTWAIQIWKSSERKNKFPLLMMFDIYIFDDSQHKPVAVPAQAALEHRKYMRPTVFLYFWQFRNQYGLFKSIQAIAKINAHAQPGQCMWATSGPRPFQVLQNSGSSTLSVVAPWQVLQEKKL